MRKQYRAAFIDDNALDLENVPRALSDERFRVTSLPYGTLDFANARSFDMYLLDFALVERARRVDRPALGTTIASQLRESTPHKPVVLVTTGKLTNDHRLRALVEADPELDDLWVKGKLEEEPGTYRKRGADLIDGYAILRGQNRRHVSWSTICRKMAAAPSDVELLAKANPVVIPPASASWRVFQAAHWLKYVVLAYPGVTYNPLHAACALGISLASFSDVAMSRLFGPARYTGPFAPVDGRWWRSQLQAIASRTLANSGAPLHHFGTAWNSSGRKKLGLAKCCVDNKSIGNCVCHILNKPVATANSFPYVPDLRPLAVMDEARVSFTAVREDNRFDEDLVPDYSRRLALEMRVGRHTR
jgi:hypothetical protein